MTNTFYQNTGSWKAGTFLHFIHPKAPVFKKVAHKRYLIHIMDFRAGSVVKNLPASAGDMGLIPGSGRSPGKGNGNPLQLPEKKPHGQKSMANISPWGCKELDMTEHACLLHSHIIGI